MGLRIAGRSSSHFTRTVRIFAHELSLDYAFEPILDLMAQSGAAYAGNPALKLPVLVTGDGAWFGALNICRELTRRANARARIVWPEDLSERVASNAQELVLQGMATEVGLIMRMLAERDTNGAYADKTRLSLVNSVTWLEAHLPQVLQRLPPERSLSFLEVSAFSFVTHLGFRQVLNAAGYVRLQQFCREFGRRPSAQLTEYQFDGS